MKNGVSYFPLDVRLNEKFELMEAEYGLNGYAVVLKLYQRIYEGEGYFCEWKNEVALLFAKQVSLGGGAVSEIVKAAIRRGIFDRALFEKYAILTSYGIQKRYFEIVSHRKSVAVKAQYLLLPYAELPKNVCIKDENDDIFKENADISRQRKEKERKGKKRRESKEAHTPPKKDPSGELDRFFNSF